MCHPRRCTSLYNTGRKWQASGHNGWPLCHLTAPLPEPDKPPAPEAPDRETLAHLYINVLNAISDAWRYLAWQATGADGFPERYPLEVSQMRDHFVTPPAL